MHKLELSFKQNFTVQMVQKSVAKWMSVACGGGGGGGGLFTVTSKSLTQSWNNKV